MKLPICGFDAKNKVLCPQYEDKVSDGTLAQADVDASVILAKIANTTNEIGDFTPYSCKEFDGNFVLYLAKIDILMIRQSRTLYGQLQGQFKGKIWLVESDETDKKFIEDLFFPTRILSINSVWVPSKVRRTKAVVSGKWALKFPIDTEKVVPHCQKCPKP